MLLAAKKTMLLTPCSYLWFWLEGHVYTMHASKIKNIWNLYWNLRLTRWTSNKICVVFEILYGSVKIRDGSTFILATQHWSKGIFTCKPDNIYSLYHSIIGSYSGWLVTHWLLQDFCIIVPRRAIPGLWLLIPVNSSSLRPFHPSFLPSFLPFNSLAFIYTDIHTHCPIFQLLPLTFINQLVKWCLFMLW